MRLAAFAVAALAAAFASISPAGPALARGPGQPVVVELFTSEGCLNHCTAAEAFLDKIARDQTLQGAEVIALELHVDLWNKDGWADPYSQAAFTARHAEYNKHFNKKFALTPQFIIDGGREVFGKREQEAEDAMRDASRAQHAKVTLTRSGDKLSITIDGLPQGNDPVDVMLAVTEDGLSGRVLGGDNAGAAVAHGAVVRDLRRVSSVAGGAKGQVVVKDVEVNVDGGWKRENLKAVAFVQRQKGMEIVGAGVLSLR